MKKLAIIFLLALTAQLFGAVIPNTAKRKVSIVVAASDSNASIRTTADFVCDGTADTVQIQAALDALPSQGGKVFCAAGDYDWTATLLLPNNVELKFEIGSTLTLSDSHALTKFIKLGEPMVAMITNANHDYTDLSNNIKVIGANCIFDGGAVTNVITGINTGTKTISVTDDPTSLVSNGEIIKIHGHSSYGTTKFYTVASTTSSTIVVNETIPDGTTSGIVVYDDKCFNPDYDDVSWAGVWLDQAQDCQIIDCKAEGIGYYSDALNGHHSFGFLLSSCIDCEVLRCEANYAGYEGFGARGDLLRVVFEDCWGAGSNTHLAQVARWFASGGSVTPSDSGNNQDVVFRGLSGEGDITSHKGTTGWAIGAASAANDTFTISGLDKTAHFQPGDVFTVQGSSANDDDWTIVEATKPGADTIIEVVENVTDDTADGVIRILTKGLIIEDCIVSDIKIMEDTQEWVVRNNTISGSIYTTAPASTINGQIIGNTIFNEKQTVSKVAIGILLTGTGGLVEDIIISNNILRNGYIYVTSSGGQTSTLNRLSIVSNEIFNEQAGVSGIYMLLGGSGDVTNVGITGNTIVGNYSVPTTVAIRFILSGAANVTGVVIQGNPYIKSAYGIATEHSSTGKVSDILIANNYFDCFNHLFKGDENESLFAEDVVILNNYVKTCQRVISFGVNKVFISGNYFKEIRSGLTGGNPTNIVFGFNDGDASNLWRSKVNLTDPDQMVIQQNVIGTWTTVETFDRTPP